MSKFQLELFQGLPIIRDGEHTLLIDTGAPSSIHTSSPLSFCSNTYNCLSNFMGLTVSSLSEMLGTEITTLLGADIVSDYAVIFDYSNQEVEFHKQDIEFEGEEVAISRCMGIPIVDLSIDAQRFKFFLDTGAKISYLPESITSSFPSIGREEDFYPGYGTFTTDCFAIQTSFGGRLFGAKFGNLPAILQTMLIGGGVDGIIGYDFFTNFRILLDLKNNRIKCA